jgi:ketosteroid isomerase-like protein
MRNVEKLRAAMDAFNSRDGERFDSFLADDAKIVPARAVIEGTIFRGPDAASQYVEAVDAIWEHLSWEIEEIRDCGDWVLALGRIRGCGRGSGAHFEATAGWIARFRDGMVTSFEWHGDRAKVLEAVGME